MAEHWIQKMVNRMKERGTVGAFGKVTAKKVARAKKEGGLEEKRAVAAENLANISRNRHRLTGG